MKKIGHGKSQTLLRSVKKYHWLYLFVLPAVVWYAMFCYAPMGGVVIAFKRFTGALSIAESPWVGLKWLVLSFYTLLTFPIPIAFALVLNEMKHERIKSLVQTIMYAPHFISIVVLVSMLNLFFATDGGFINRIIEALGGTPIEFLQDSKAFSHMYVWSGVWQNLGWNCIIYVAALSAVDPALHEAAMLDGASRMQRILHINLPTIMPTIIIMLIMRVGHIMSVGADKVLLMKNDLNADAAQIISTSVYERGLLQGDFSYSTAVGLFVNVINLLMILMVNKISAKVSETSLF